MELTATLYKDKKSGAYQTKSARFILREFGDKGVLIGNYKGLGKSSIDLAQLALKAGYEQKFSSEILVPFDINQSGTICSMKVEVTTCILKQIANDVVSLSDAGSETSQEDFFLAADFDHFAGSSRNSMRKSRGGLSPMIPNELTSPVSPSSSKARSLEQVKANEEAFQLYTKELTEKNEKIHALEQQILEDAEKHKEEILTLKTQKNIVESNLESALQREKMLSNNTDIAVGK